MRDVKISHTRNCSRSTPDCCGIRYGLCGCVIDAASSQQIEQADHPHTANEGAERTAEKQIAYYTKWLAWFTAALVAVSAIQGYFLLRADKTARIAANAGQLSAESAHGLALPIIGADSPELLDTHGPIPEDGAFGGSSQGDLPGEFSAIPAIIFRNDGQTPAFPIKVVVEWRIGALSSDGNPRFKIYEYSSAIIPRGGEWESEIYYEIQIPEGERTILGQKGSFLWLRVTLFYRDFLKKERAVIFRWRWDNPGGGMYFFESEGARDTQYQQGEEQLRAPACLSQRI